MHLNFNELLKKLIQESSYSADEPQNDVTNEGVIDFLAQTLSSENFKIYKQKVKKARNKYNLIAQIGPNEKGGIAFSGHTDTVPTDSSLWNSNPFELAEDDKKFYGLGVIDMKGFFAHIINTLNNIDLSTLKKPIYILATADEETTMSGAIELADFLKDSSNFNFKPDLICIGEPTSLVPVIMHKGQIVIKVKTTGLSGHSSNPDAGVNAIKIMNKVISSLNDFEEKLRTIKEPMFAVDHPTLNMGQLNGGDAPNRICDQCELVFDIRTLPTQKTQDMFLLVKEHLKDLMQEYGNYIELSIAYDPVEAFGAEHNTQTIDILRKITNKEPIAVNYATEATYLQNLGETVILGAGDIANAHQPNEYLLKEEIPQIQEIYQSLIKHFCL